MTYILWPLTSCPNRLSLLPSKVRNEALALLLAIDPRRLRWLPSPQQLDALGSDLATLPLAKLFAFLHSDQDASAAAAAAANGESKESAFATAAKVLESTSLFSHYAHSSDAEIRALQSEVRSPRHTRAYTAKQLRVFST